MAEVENAVPSMDLSRYVAIMRRHWTLTLVITLLGGGLAVAYLAVTPPRFTASTLVNVNVISTAPFNQGRAAADLIDPQTEVQMVRSSSVINTVASELDDGQTAADVRAATEALVLPDGTVTRISFTASSAEGAKEGADAVADAYLKFRAQLVRDRVEAIIEQLTLRRDEIREALVGVNERLADAEPGTSAAAQARSDRSVLSRDLDALLDQINSLSGIDASGGSVLTLAEDATLEVSPRPLLVLATGLLGSLILGIVAAFVANVLDRRVRDAYDVTGAGGGAVLTRLPSRRGTVNTRNGDADGIRSLRERLLASLPPEDPVLCMAEVNRGADQLDVEVNLAIAVAASGMAVDLIVPEHSERSVSEVRRALDMVAHPGTTTWKQFQSPVTPGLTLLVPWADARNRAPTADMVVELLRSREGSPGMTMIALPPEGSRSLLLAAGRLGHAVVLVLSEAETRIDQVARLATELQAVGATVHGSVLLRKGRQMVVPRDVADAEVASRLHAAKEADRQVSA